MADKTVTLKYRGNSTRPFGVRVLGQSYRFDPNDTGLIELDSLRANTLLALEPDLWEINGGKIADLKYTEPPVGQFPEIPQAAEKPTKAK